MELQNSNNLFLRVAVLIFILVTLTHASHIMWQSDYESARQQAVAEDKKILVFVVQKKNKKINAILQKSFMNQVYIDTMNKNFVAVIVHPATAQNYRDRSKICVNRVK